MNWNTYIKLITSLLTYSVIIYLLTWFGLFKLFRNFVLYIQNAIKLKRLMNFQIFCEEMYL